METEIKDTTPIPCKTARCRGENLVLGEIAEGGQCIEFGGTVRVWHKTRYSCVNCYKSYWFLPAPLPIDLEQEKEYESN